MYPCGGEERQWARGEAEMAEEEDEEVGEGEREENKGGEEERTGGKEVRKRGKGGGEWMGEEETGGGRRGGRRRRKKKEGQEEEGGEGRRCNRHLELVHEGGERAVRGGDGSFEGRRRAQTARHTPKSNAPTISAQFGPGTQLH
eukprot:3395892-Rhodomonas_salina.3